MSRCPTLPQVLYGALSGALFTLVFPALWGYGRLSGRIRSGLPERLGRPASDALRRLGPRPRVWFHAASLGEVRVGAAIIRALRVREPRLSILVSVMTEHGRRLARRVLDPDIPVVFAPLDFPPAVHRALKLVQPDVLVFLETEIWPNWAFEARRMGIRTALINGRISRSSFGRYRKIRIFLRSVLKGFDSFSMSTQEDADRIRTLGAVSRKIAVHGSAKYDLLTSDADPQLACGVRRLLALGAEQPVLVAGSTRKGEEHSVLRAFERIRQARPDALLIIAPRHVERTAAVASQVRARGLDCQLKTQLERGRPRSAPVVILNTFGELFHFYSVASLVFCGGSLVPLGGQNPLEPAAWLKPVLFGPHMENFLDAKRALEAAGGGFQIRNGAELAERALWLLADDQELKKRGAQAHRALLMCQGASQAHARSIADLLTREQVSV